MLRSTTSYVKLPSFTLRHQRQKTDLLVRSKLLSTTKSTLTFSSSTDLKNTRSHSNTHSLAINKQFSLKRETLNIRVHSSSKQYKYDHQQIYKRCHSTETKIITEKEKNQSLTKHERGSQWKQSLEIAKNSLISRRRIPPNFLKDVFIPHLENWIWEAKMCPPWYLMEVVIAYSQMPMINQSLTTILADTVIERITDYNGPEFCKMLFPFYRMRPTDLIVFAHLSIELEEHFYELTTLNLIAIIRVYARLKKNDQQLEFIDKMVIPRLQTDIARYDTEELSALLVSLAATPKMDVSGDVPLLAAIIPQIEKRYDETPLLTTIVNLNALCRLRVLHKRLLNLAIKDLSDRWRIRNIPPKYIAVALWTFARFGLLDQILPAFEELIEYNIDKFTAREFARFCQALPEGSSLTLRIAISLLEQLPTMTKDHFLFFFIGIVRRGYFPLRDGEGIPKAGISTNELNSQFSKTDENEDKRFYTMDDECTITEDKSHLHDADDEFSSTTCEEDILHERQTQENWTCMGDQQDHEDTPIVNDAGRIPRETFLHECLHYIETYEDDFEVNEIHRLGQILRHSVNQQYGYISTLLPNSWETLIHEVMIMGK